MHGLRVIEGHSKQVRALRRISEVRSLCRPPLRLCCPLVLLLPLDDALGEPSTMRPHNTVGEALRQVQGREQLFRIEKVIHVQPSPSIWQSLHQPHYPTMQR